MARVEFNAVKKCYDDVQVIDKLDLEIKPGEIYGLVGPDGAGKTTTLRMLAAIMDPSRGRATIAGLDLFYGLLQIGPVSPI